MKIDPKDWIEPRRPRADLRGPMDRPFTAFPEPDDAGPILDHLKAMVRDHPDRLAAEGQDLALTYSQLWAAVCRLRAQIEALDLAPGPVAILLHNDPTYLVALYAVLAAGRVSLLLDKGYPDSRNAELMAATDAVLVISTGGGDWPKASGLDVGCAFDASMPATAETRPLIDLDAPALIICTSGSTGRPKAIVHNQRAMLHWAATTINSLHLTPDDQTLCLTSPSALGGLTPLLAFSLAGASLQMVEIKAVGLGGLLQILKTRPVTVLRAAPSFIRSFAPACGVVPSLRAVQLYSEPLLKSDLPALRRLLPPGCLVRSAYGSTEAPNGVYWFVGDDDDYDPFRVAGGVLVPGVSAIVLNDDGAICAPGEAGELLIRSRYNALGEWIDGAIVPGRLEPDPFDPRFRIYRTGDTAKYHADGVFVVLGRKDRMVKINGHRAEPAEVETILRQQSGVAEAEILARVQGGATIFVAFVVLGAQAAPDLAANLKETLRRGLPSYMVPSRIIEVETMPRLPGGKVDQAGLLALAAAGAGARR